MNKEEYFLYLNSHNDDKRIVDMENYAQEFKVPIIQKMGLNFIVQMIKVSKCQNILEIGTAIGYSAINFALVNNDINVTTIERDELMVQLALQNIKRFDLQSRIKVLYHDAKTFDEKQLGIFDLLFIDAAKSQYQAFFEKYTPCLKKGSIVITDNLIFHDLVFETEIKSRNTKQLVNKIKNYNEWLKNNELFDTMFYNIGDGISVSIKK